MPRNKKYTKTDFSQTGEVEVTASPAIEKILKETFDIETEIMAGTREKLPDGRSRLTFTVKGQKAKLIYDFMISTIGNLNKINLN